MKRARDMVLPLARLAMAACSMPHSDSARGVGQSADPARAHQHGTPGPDARPILYESLGTYSYRITTASPDAQRWFDQGLRLVYAFNHQEAQRAFLEAARLDPGCAMC